MVLLVVVFLFVIVIENRLVFINVGNDIMGDIYFTTVTVMDD